MIINVRNNSKKVIQKEKIATLKILEILVKQTIQKPSGHQYFCKIQYEKQIFKIENIFVKNSGAKYEIKIETSGEINFDLYCKSILCGTEEIGSCKIQISEFEEKKLKKSIVFQNEIVGEIEFIGKISNDSCMSTQSTCNSLDMKDDFVRDSTNLDLDAFKPMNFFSHFQHTNAKSFESSFDEKNEENIHKFIEKISEKKKKILLQQQEILEHSEKLDQKSRLINIERLKNCEEAELIQKERIQLEGMIKRLNLNFYELKHDKFRKRAHKKLIEKTKNRISDNLNKIRSQKSMIDRKRPLHSGNKENLDYSVLGLSESVLPVTNSESPVPDEPCQ